MNRNIFFKIRAITFHTSLIFFSLLVLGTFQNPILGQDGSWKAPASADKYINPVQGNDKATLIGKELYTQFCAICHGKKGKGNGVAEMALKPRPSNFTKAIVQKQTDGAIYWKMTEGKAPMAAYKEVLTEEQRRQLVNFIRSLNK